MQNTPLLTLTVRASGAVTKRRLIKFGGAQATTADEKVMGVAETNAADGELVSVTCKGTAIVEAAGEISVGEPLTTDNQGRAAVSDEATDYVFGDALEDAAGAGSLIEVLMR